MAHQSVGSWAKRCYFAGRAAMEVALRPYDLGASQWYVLYFLTHDGPTIQGELLGPLQIERATLSVIVGALVKKGLVEQVPDTADQRRKLLRMTAAGTELWHRLPDLETLIGKAAFDGIDPDDIDVAIRVLRIATERLETLTKNGVEP